MPLRPQLSHCHWCHCLALRQYCWALAIEYFSFSWANITITLSRRLILRNTPLRRDTPIFITLINIVIIAIIEIIDYATLILISIDYAISWLPLLFTPRQLHFILPFSLIDFHWCHLLIDYDITPAAISWYFSHAAIDIDIDDITLVFATLAFITLTLLLIRHFRHFIAAIFQLKPFSSHFA